MYMYIYSKPMCSLFLCNYLVWWSLIRLVTLGISIVALMYSKGKDGGVRAWSKRIHPIYM